MRGQGRRQLNPVLLWLFLVLLSFPCSRESSAQAPKMEQILYGASYYHEYMPYERLEQDVQLMKEAGFNVVRLGESAWSSWEPRENEFDFAWMDRILDRLHQ